MRPGRKKNSLYLFSIPIFQISNGDIYYVVNWSMNNQGDDYFFKVIYLKVFSMNAPWKIKTANLTYFQN